MKQLLSVTLLFIAISSFSQTIYTPTYVNSDNKTLTIDKIELGLNSTIFYCTHTNTYEAGAWVRIDPNIYLKDTYSSRQYQLIKAEGIPLSPNEFKYSYKGQSLSFRLIFNRIASDIFRIDMIECKDVNSCFNFYGVKIKDVPDASTTSHSEGRTFLRDQIQQWGKCKNVAMTLTGGDVALYGDNGWAAKAAPKAMTDKLHELNGSDNLIDDIVLTEQGRWLILWGNNGISSFDVPSSLFQKLKKWNDENEVIMSVTFNDNGDWIAITKTKYSASSEKVMDFIKEGENKYGELWAAHLTNDGLVLCYAKGYKFLGEVPENLKTKLNETKINVYRIQFLKDGAYFIADFSGNYDYYM